MSFFKFRIEKNGCVKISKNVLKTEESFELQKLRENEGMFKSILDNIQDAYIRSDKEGRIILVSPSASRMYRFDSPQEMLGLSALSLYKNVKDRNSLIEKLNENGKAEDFESIALRKDGTTFSVSLNSQYYYDDNGQIQGTEAFIRDITGRKNAEFERGISKDFLEIVNESNNISELINSALTFFKQKSKCQAVGIRLKEGEDYPYYETQGFPKYFIKMENNLCSYNGCGKPDRDSAGNPIMECMCGNVICGRFNPSQPFFTNNGSFWTNSTTKLLKNSSEEDRQARTRNRCNGEGYESVALIPLNSGNEKVGLLQLNDTRKNIFSQEFMTLWERLTGYLSIALTKFQAEEHTQKLLEKEQQLTEELQSSNEELQFTTDELYKSNEELQKYLKMLSTIYELNPDSIVLTTLSESKIIDCNQEYLNQIGYTREETIGHKSLELNILNPDTRKNYLDETSGNKISYTELKVKRKDGSVIDVLYSSRPIMVNNEELILNIGHDITKRKQNEQEKQKLLENEQQLTEELQIINNELVHQGEELLKINKELEESEVRFHDLADNIPNLAWMAEADGGIFWYNQQWYDYTGTNLKEMQGWGWQKVHHPDYIESVTEEWSKKIEEGIPYDNIFPLRGKDGNYRWFLTRVTPIKNKQGELVRWFGTNTDITDYKVAEEKIQQQANLISQSFDALIVGQLNGGIESWNHGAEELYGYTESEAVGKPIYELLNTVFPNPWSQISEKISNGGMWEGEVKHRTKNGETVIVSSRIQNIIQNDNSSKLLETNRDITKRKRAEEHIIKLLKEEQQLTEELSATNEELQATSEELQSSNEELMMVQNNLTEMINKLKISNKELEQFAYVASHDLQEPLRMVSSFTQLLEKRYKNQLDNDADDYIGFVVEGAKRMKQLIDDLLAFSRLNTDIREFEPILMEIALDDVLLNLKASIKEHNAQITHKRLPCIKGDPLQISQLLQNLIGNAIKFHGDNPPQIHISAQELENEWVFSIKDNGIGINKRHQEQIFSIFKRLNTREEYPGTGIGLSICKRIVERHGGHIWLESKPGQGSIFYFTIPI